MLFFPVNQMSFHFKLELQQIGMLKGLGGPQVYADVVKRKLKLSFPKASTEIRIIIYKELTFVSSKRRKEGI